MAVGHKLKRPSQSLYLNPIVTLWYEWLKNILHGRMFMAMFTLQASQFNSDFLLRSGLPVLMVHIHNDVSWM